MLVLVLLKKKKYDYEDDADDLVGLILNVKRGTFEILLFLEERVFHCLHPLGGIRHLEGGGVLLVLII